MLSEYGRQGNTKYLHSRNKLGKWKSTTQYWPWIGYGNFIVNLKGEKFECVQEKYVRSANVTDNKLLPVEVKTRNGLVTRVNKDHYGLVQVQRDKYKRLQGHFLGNKDKITIDDKVNSFTAASDGSVLNGRGAAAATIHTHNGSRQVLNLTVPVDGISDDLTSYRVEAFGLLALLLAIKNTLDPTKDYKNLTGKIVVDNEAVVKKYNKLQGTHPYSIKSANETDSDILQELRHLKASLLEGIKCLHVKGHQKNQKHWRLDLI